MRKLDFEEMVMVWGEELVPGVNVPMMFTMSPVLEVSLSSGKRRMVTYQQRLGCMTSRPPE